MNMKAGDIYYSNKEYKIIDGLSSNGEVAFFLVGLNLAHTYCSLVSSCVKPIKDFEGEYIGSVEHNDNYYIFVADALKKIAEDIKSRFPELPQSEVRDGSIYQVDERKYIMISALRMHYTEYYEIEVHLGRDLEVNIKVLNVKTKEFTIPDKYIGRIPVVSDDFLANMTDLLKVITEYRNKERKNHNV